MCFYFVSNKQTGNKKSGRFNTGLQSFNMQCLFTFWSNKRTEGLMDMYQKGILRNLHSGMLSIKYSILSSEFDVN